MRAYSHLNLLNRRVEITGRSGFSTIIGSLFESKYVTLEIRIPTYDYLRGRQFVNDLKAILGEDMDPNFRVEHIFVTLYQDFLRQVRGGADLLDLAKLIMAGKKHFAGLDAPVEVDFVSKNSFVMVREDRPKRVKKENRPVYLPIQVFRNEVERGEYLLYDMETLYPELDITVEELISIRYRDFMHEVKNGNNRVIRALMSNIRHD